MFLNTLSIILMLAIATACARILQIKNIASVPLLVSVTGQNDLVVLPGTSAFVTVTEDFSGSISAVSNNSENADIPRTKAQLTLSASGDSYAVSLIDGFNLRAKIVPIQGVNCTIAVCSANINYRCPIENQVVNSVGEVVACANTPALFRAVCPRAVVSSEDVINVHTCQAISYRVLLG